VNWINIKDQEPVDMEPLVFWDQRRLDSIRGTFWNGEFHANTHFGKVRVTGIIYWFYTPKPPTTD